MRVLVLGSGGREHALAWAIARSPLVEEVLCAPGSDGIARHARCVGVDLADATSILELVKREDAALVVVGPEDPLVGGIADRLSDAGVAVFGPGAAAARLEGSKAFAKAFMERHGIPTAAYRAFEDPDVAESYIRERGGPVVVKADGLAAVAQSAAVLTRGSICARRIRIHPRHRPLRDPQYQDRYPGVLYPYDLWRSLPGVFRSPAGLLPRIADR